MQTVVFRAAKSVPASDWEKLERKKVFFGHQSVGNDILDGIADVARDNSDIRLNVKEVAQDLPDSSLFIHSLVGKNLDPISKCNDFAEKLGKMDGINIAILKFCFVDFSAETNDEEVFNYYKKHMVMLKNTYPDTVFVHMTVPLTTVQEGPKVWFKQMIGRPVGGYAENAKRNTYNSLLKKEYEGKEPIFDLAGIESTMQDGKRAYFTIGGKEYACMVPDYTSDGGHLNSKGRRIVAEQFLVFLAQL